MRIALFDSGLGGLTVLGHARRALPDEEFLFFADRDHVPYGTKTVPEVRGFVRAAFRFLIDKERAEAIVVACNTATSVSADEMRRLYDIPIIGMEPAVKKALDADGTRRVLVTGTPITVCGEKLHRLIKTYDAKHLVDLLPLPRLVEFAEHREFVSPRVEEYLRDALRPFDLTQYSAMVLGCTHFNYFKDTLRNLLPETMTFADGNDGTVEELARRAGLTTLPEGARTARCTFFESGRRVARPEALARIESYIDRAERMELIN
ncbi:glutamate racemase [Selenomonas sp. F0473]|uniref:glutamate racemase n=1 Tax=Selenomonas sp. F0473 TaxID=999423 RepID=UPI0025D01BEF|nr:glutamate racemase [Selenomonas sp. F0473]